MDTTSNDKYYTLAEVAEIRDVSIDTVRRDRADRGRYPNARQRVSGDPNSPWEIPLSDLIAAGHVTAGDSEVPAPEDVGHRSRRDRETAQLRESLACERIRSELLTSQLRDRDESIRFLQKTLDSALAARQAA